MIDINNFEPVLKFKDDILNCDFLSIKSESDIKESCNVTERGENTSIITIYLVKSRNIEFILNRFLNLIYKLSKQLEM